MYGVYITLSPRFDLALDSTPIHPSNGEFEFCEPLGRKVRGFVNWNDGDKHFIYRSELLHRDCQLEVLHPPVGSENADDLNGESLSKSVAAAYV